jgi:hypothetical protein
MNADQYQAGLDRIYRAISPLNKAASIGYKLCGPAAAPCAMFSVAIPGNVIERLFAFEDIEDSHEQLTPEAKAKIGRLLAEAAQLPITSSAFSGAPTQEDRAPRR